MSDINNCTIVGRLTKDSELKNLTNTQLCTFDVANNTGWGDNEKTTFFSVKLWGKRASSLSQYLVKGKRVVVAGEITLDKWDYQGKEYQKLCINASNVQLLDGGDAPENTERFNRGSSSLADESLAVTKPTYSRNKEDDGAIF